MQSLDERIIALNARLDRLINFQDRDKYLAGGAAIGGTGLAGYGLYRRGRSLGQMAVGKKGKRQIYTTPSSRGIIGNVEAGARSIGEQAVMGANLLRRSEIRGAIKHDIGAGVRGGLSRLTKIFR